MTNRTCSLDGCDAPHLAKGYCGTHYRRAMRHGDPTVSVGTGNASPLTASRVCEVEGCSKPVRTKLRDLCRSHNQLFVSTGTVDPIVGTLERFMRFVKPVSSGCWEWQGSRMGSGLRYGQFSLKAIGKRTAYAHRVSWELHRGQIPEDLSIDHLCMNTICVNPDHLEPVPQSVNRQRYADSITHCKRGHEFTEANTYRAKDGHRQCRTCTRNNARKYREARQSVKG